MNSIQIVLADDDADDRSLFYEAHSEAQSTAKLITLEDGQQLMNYLDEIESPPPPDIPFFGHQYAL